MLVRTRGKGNPNLALLGGCKLWKTVWSFITRLKIELPYPTTQQLQYWVFTPKDTKTLIQRDTCPHVYRSSIYNSQDAEAARVSISR